jgi:hypothetical protein
LGTGNGIAHAPASIDARPENKAKIVHSGLAHAAGIFRQRHHADILAVAQDLQALRNDGAIEPRQRRDIAHRADRGEIEHLDQVRQMVCARRSAPAGFAIDRRERHQNHARRCQMTLPRAIVQAVRIDDRARIEEAREYYTRAGDLSLGAHQALFDEYRGPKHMLSERLAPAELTKLLGTATP